MYLCSEIYFFWVYNQKSKTPSNSTCLGEPPVRFLRCWLSSLFCCCSSFVIFSHSHFLFDIIPHPSVDSRQVFTPILYFQPSPSQSDSRHFHFQPFRYLLTASATVLSGHFLPTGVFYLMLLPDIFGKTCFYQGFPGSRQLFLKICRASYWSSKHRLGPSICLIHSNPQSFIRLKFCIYTCQYCKSFTCGENFKKIYRPATTLFSSHENIKQQPH